MPPRRRACKQNHTTLAGPEIQMNHAPRAHGRDESDPRVQIHRGCKKPKNVPKQQFLQQNNFIEKIAHNRAYSMPCNVIAQWRAASHAQAKIAKMRRRKKARRQNGMESCRWARLQKYARLFVELAQIWPREHLQRTRDTAQARSAPRVQETRSYLDKAVVFWKIPIRVHVFCDRKKRSFYKKQLYFLRSICIIFLILTIEK